MKTITIDFALYQQELLNERTRGFEIVRDLKLKIVRVVDSMNGCSKKEFDDAHLYLCKILNDLNEKPFPLKASEVE